ncbi:PepSY domain-containing protein [Sphingosinithalassobacter sp. CS137]|uniref:PepSY domain-containing protein n=1 Tax=Sphingosinithalassobacter sp. CS137 TaxID=2762748 RepID=UPI0021CE63CC|nr:PepSY-associated TM helix domain-containing protein [Sphingosinithalassobacter sp. CS137]
MARVAGAGWYNAVWRWHFYAGLLTMPFVLWLTVTGTIYLWKPQIEAMLEHRFETIEAVGPRESAGRANQLLGTLTALGLATLSLSSFVLWWRRRPEGKLGAPPPSRATALRTIARRRNLPARAADAALRRDLAARAADRGDAVAALAGGAPLARPAACARLTGAAGATKCPASAQARPLRLAV